MKIHCPQFHRTAQVLIAALIACTAAEACSSEAVQKSPATPSEVSEASTLKMPAALAAAGFTRFAAAIEAAGLTKTLEDDGPFTCFAPSDKAFNAMPDETRKLLKENPAGEDAQAWIKYHFVKGVALKRDDLTKIPGANGFADKYLRVWVTPGKISINRVCEVTRFDIRAGNGFIHEVDRVLDAEDEIKMFQKKS
jgi:uncharacterized surface protein with fasciclin (FAS1) repeats